MNATEVLELTKNSLRTLGMNENLAVLVNENLVGDDDPRCEGYIQMDGIDIYPQLVGDEVGWGVSAGVTIPGCHTLPNGDPGYPDVADAVDILEPSFTTKGIAGEYTHARDAHYAVRAAIVAWVEYRLDDIGPDDYFA